MGHRNLTETVADLERHGHLRRVDAPIDPCLEMAEIQRRLYAQAGPAVLFTSPKGTRFPMLANMFGTLERTQFLFRDALEDVRKLVELKTKPEAALKKPWRYWNLPFIAWRLRPKFNRRGPILEHTIRLSELPQLKSWPMDGGAFVTLPQVYTEHPEMPGWMKSNLGMYRVQISGNDFDPEGEVGMHYQIHRGIGVHHSVAHKKGEKLRVNVFVGGPPALTLSAVMPLPEGLPELAFAGAIGGRRLPLVRAANGLPMPAECDFVISGTIDPTATKPEGPFGDHLGYYSLTHDFPVMKVDKVYHRPGAIWPFTVVGRPPQEDTSFGEIIHDLTGPVIPTVLPGVKGIHAVDAAGVHPLLLAIGSERYTPYAGRKRPQELLTIASAILGQGQLSLAKFLLIVAQEDQPNLDIHDIPAFFRHLLERVDWSHDLHFHTRTTLDTLDYSAGEGINAGSKVVIAAVGEPRRTLSTTLPANLSLPDGFREAKLVAPGIIAVTAPKHAGLAAGEYEPAFARFCREARISDPGLPLVVLTDDADFTARRFDNFLWETFTRANPATDILGLEMFTHRKHFGCHGPLVLDARLKPHMAPPLIEDPAVSQRVDDMTVRGGPLHGILK
ncbi:MAG: UbiD family decarboxylase [Fimbriiglobus sp.]